MHAKSKAPEVASSFSGVQSYHVKELAVPEKAEGPLWKRDAFK